MSGLDGLATLGTSTGCISGALTAFDLNATREAGCEMDRCLGAGVGARRRPQGLVDLQIGASRPVVQPIDLYSPNLALLGVSGSSSACSSTDHTCMLDQYSAAPASARAIELAALVSPSVLGALGMCAYNTCPTGCSPRLSPASTPTAAMLAIRG